MAGGMKRTMLWASTAVAIVCGIVILISTIAGGVVIQLLLVRDFTNACKVRHHPLLLSSPSQRQRDREM